MKRFYSGLILGFIIGFIVCALLLYWYSQKNKENGNDSPKDQPMKIGGHSSAFNNSIDTLLGNYFALTDAFVNADSVKAKAAGEKLSASIGNIPLEDIKNDTSLKQDALTLYSTDSMSLADIKSFSDTLVKGITLDKMSN